MVGMMKVIVAACRRVDEPIVVLLTDIHLVIPAQLHCCTVGSAEGGATVEGAAVAMLHMESIVAFNLFTVATRSVGIIIISAIAIAYISLTFRFFIVCSDHCCHAEQK